MGVFFSDLIQLDLWWLAGVLIGIILALIVWWKEIYWRLMLFILIGLIVGLGYYRFWDSRQRAIEMPYNQELTVDGQVVGHPDILANQARYVIGAEGKKIQINTGRFPEYHYGDKLKVKGVLKEPKEYWFHQGILAVIYNPENIEKAGAGGNILTSATYKIRDKFEETLNRSLSEPYASFAAGLVLGSKRNIPETLMSDFNRTGTTHIIAVSGYNVTIVITYIGLLLGLFSRRWRFWGSLLAILGFVVMTGAPASVVRAGIFAGLVAFGKYEGRRVNMTIILLIVALLMLLFNPYALKFDISFQLSFLAFAGLVYLSSLIDRLKIIQWLPGIWKSTFAETMGAQILVFPMLIYHFGRVSIVAPPTNILILWIIPTTMLFIFVVGIGGLIWGMLGQFFGYIGWLFLKYIIIVVESFSKIPWASRQVEDTGIWWIIVFYVIIVLIINKLPRSKLTRYS